MSGPKIAEGQPDRRTWRHRRNAAPASAGEAKVRCSVAWNLAAFLQEPRERSVPTAAMSRRADVSSILMCPTHDATYRSFKHAASVFRFSRTNPGSLATKTAAAKAAAPPPNRPPLNPLEPMLPQPRPLSALDDQPPEPPNPPECPLMPLKAVDLPPWCRAAPRSSSLRSDRS